MASLGTRAEGPTVFDEFVARTYDSESGMPDDSATAMVQTADGFLWFGTLGGLVRFDGMRFRAYTPANTPEMHDSGVVNLHLDRTGCLWCSTFAGLVRMRDGVWQRVDRDLGWTTDYARTFAEAPDGTVYVTGFDGKVLRQEGQGFVELSEPPGPVEGALGHCDAEGRFWAVKRQFVGYLDGGGWERVLPAPASPEFLGAGPARDGSLWVLRKGGLLKVGADGVLQNIGLEGVTDDFWSLYEHSNGEVWIASYKNGLYRVQWTGDQGKALNYSRATGHGLAGVRFVREDHEGNTWVGLNSLGLLRMRPRVFANYGLGAGLQEPNVKAVTVDTTGQIWIGTYGGGVYRVDSPRFGEARLALAASDWTPYVDSLMADRQGRLWVATFGTGSPVFQIENGQPRQVLNDGARDSSRTALFQDSKGRVWLGGPADLACSEAEKWTRFPLPGVRALAEEPGTGVLWASTPRGLYRRPEETFIEVDGPNGRPLASALCLQPQADGSLWIGTADRGLLQRRPDGTFREVGPSKGLPAETVLAIIEDDLGNWWLVSDSGVIRVDGKAVEEVASGKEAMLQAALYTAREGLVRRFGPDLRQPLAAKTPDGRLWLASPNGLVEVAPAAVRRDPHPPRVVMTRMSYRNAKGAITEAAFLTSGRYEVAPRGRALSIEFAALSYAAPERVLCATRLEHRGELIASSYGQDREVSYEMLPPGDYTLHVSAANADGVWNQTGLTVPFRIRPTYWQTPWFRAGLGVLFSALVAGTILHVNRQRSSALRRRAAALLAERQRVAQDIHDGCQQTLLAAQVQVQLARERWPDAPPAARQALATAEALNRQTLAEAHQAVWDLRHETAPEAALESQLRAVIATTHCANRLEAQFTSAGQPWPLTPGQFAELRRLTLEAVTNVLKHAHAKRLEIRLDYRPDRLVLEVLDDGCGFDPAAARPDIESVGLGLASMRHRAAKLGASFHVFSAAGQGTCVRVVVPRPQ